ncbi:MAG: DNA primase [Desulfamplus sp.]|nr:DNA primase [Desulfamplus sp.]
MQAIPSPKILSGSETDYSLLLMNLKDAVTREPVPSDAMETLGNRSIWENLSPDLMLQWASISQASHNISLALEAYEYLTRRHPEYHQGWHNYLELLSLTGRTDELGAKVARARMHLPGELVNDWVQLLCSHGRGAGPGGVSRKIDDAAASPMETMNRKRELMGHFMELFSGREDIFARQWVDRGENKSGYVPVQYAMTLAHVEEHLSGRKTYGIYLLKQDSTVRCGVIDADILPRFRQGGMNAEEKRLIYREKKYMISRINEASRAMGISPLIEFSGHKGYHFWYFFKKPLKAGVVKSFLTRIAEPVNRDISSFDLEVFPKQEQLTGKGLGNLVKLPLGIHRKNGKPSFFVACEKKDVESQLEFLKKVTPSDILENAGLGMENGGVSQFVNGELGMGNEGLGMESGELKMENAGVSQPVYGFEDGCGLQGRGGAARHGQDRGNEDGPCPKNAGGEVVLHPRMAAFAAEYPDIYQLEQLCPPLGQLIAACRSNGEIRTRDEKVLYQTLGFLPRGRRFMHYLMGSSPDYNPHMVDFKLSRVAGTPLGCRRIHSLLGFTGDFCPMEHDTVGYLHPLIHLQSWKNCAETKSPKSMKIDNLQDALENMKTAILQVQRFMAV